MIGGASAADGADVCECPRATPGLAAVLAALVVWAGPGRCAEHAVASYEGDVSPWRAVPAWKAGTPWDKDKTGPSMMAWTVVQDGKLVQKAGAPKGIAMHVKPSPFSGAKAYTVEMRFRVTECARDGWYRNPLGAQLGNQFVYVRCGLPPDYQGGYVWLNLYLKPKHEHEVAIKGDEFIEGEWLTVRFVVQDRLSKRTFRTFLNGKEIQNMTAGKGEFWFGDRFVIMSDDVDDGWEIDYVRWTHKAVGIDTALERPLTEEERKELGEQGYRQKLLELLE